MTSPKTDEKVDVTVSHNQLLEGRERKAGDTVSVPKRMARALVSRGAAKYKQKGGK